MNCWKNEIIGLRAFEEEDASFFKECLDMHEMQHGNCDIRFPISLKACEKLVGEFTEKDNDDPEGQILIIMDNGKNNIGIIDVHNVDVKSGYFEYGISILPQYRIRGFEENAIKMLIRYFFYERRFQKVNVIYDLNT